jgi:hypothetical protein
MISETISVHYLAHQSHMLSVMLMLRLLWALPWSLLGLSFGLAALATGGRSQRVGRVLEFHGGLLERLLRWVPIAGGAAAMTLGHVVIARTAADLDRSRRHELIHVAQYERWGPLFVPAYMACSAWLWLRGLDAYLDNPFEEEAYQGEQEA